MATLLAPYNNSMKLGSGFNTFTQELCIDHAVIRPEDPKVDASEQIVQKPSVAQQVTYKTTVVDKVTDVTEALNINAAFSIKYDKINAEGKGGIVNTNTLKSSDINFMISVKVVNEVIMDHSLTKFSPINGVAPNEFTNVYGDSFISGFQEGGEFVAIISIKVTDRDQLESIKAEAALSLTMNQLEVKGSGDLDKSRKDLLKENETTISVAWTGGGQDLKKPEEDWTYETMRAAARKFPEMVAKTPMRTHAILTKYTALKSFQQVGQHFSPLNYENAGNYTTALQEAYLDFKNIAKDIQVMAFDVVNGTKKLSPRPDVSGKEVGEHGMVAAKPALLADMTSQKDAAPKEPEPSSTESTGSEDFTKVKASDAAPDAPSTAVTTTTSSSTTPAKTVQPLIVQQPYPATIFGLEAARVHCRFMMNRIVEEVDEVTKHPEIATSETRPMPYMSPFLFRLLMPLATPVNPILA